MNFHEIAAGCLTGELPLAQIFGIGSSDFALFDNFQRNEKRLQPTQRPATIFADIRRNPFLQINSPPIQRGTNQIKIIFVFFNFKMNNLRIKKFQKYN